MWQNLPPDIGENFVTQQAVVEERELIDAVISKEDGQNIQWMVFKVKKRAKKDFEVYRRSLLTDNLSAMAPSLAGRIPESYNWPYDYFSLVELAKIDETVHYVSTDLKKLAPLTEQEALEVENVTNPNTPGASDAPIGDLDFEGPPPPGGLQGQAGGMDQANPVRFSPALVQAAADAAASGKGSGQALIRKRVTGIQPVEPAPASTTPMIRRRGTYSESNE